MKLLLVAGMILFLIGLLSGMLIPYYEDHRMGMSTHLVGVQNAIVLIVFGLMFSHISISAKYLSLLSALSIYSMYAIWLSVALAATSTVNADNSAPALKETITKILLYSGSLAIIIAAILITIGLIRKK